MQHIAPLLQTVLWVLLVAGIVIRFHKQIHGLLAALQRRIESGSSVKAGFFELGAEIQPLPPEQQRTKAAAELSQITEELEPSQNEPTPTTSQVHSRFYQAEDLALRAVQNEFKAPINRQVSIGPGIEADGAFVYRERLHLVEVKFVVRPKNANSTVRRTLEHYANAFGRYRRRDITIVLALVFQYEPDVEVNTNLMSQVAAGFPVDVIVRGYSLPELQKTYGAPSSGDA